MKGYSSALTTPMHWFSLHSTKAELARWANLGTEGFLHWPEEILPACDSAYPVLSRALAPGERVMVMAQLAPITLQPAPALPSERPGSGSSHEDSAGKAPTGGIRQRPCLVPIQSFRAMRLAPNGAEEPYSFAPLSGDIIGLAGILEERTEAATRLLTYSVLCVDAPPLLKPFFQQLPAVVEPSGYSVWLQWDGVTQDAYSRLIRPLPSIALREWQTIPADREAADGLCASRHRA